MVDAKIRTKIPIMADFLIAYSSWLDYKSYRNAESGSIFLQTLAEQLTMHGAKLSILDVISKLNYVIAYEYQKSEEEQQMSSAVFSLTRRLVFKPKGSTSK